MKWTAVGSETYIKAEESLEERRVGHKPHEEAWPSNVRADKFQTSFCSRARMLW